MITEWLKQNPHERFSYDDQTEAKQLLVELGIIGQFSQNPPEAKGQQSQQMIMHHNHPTHFIGAILYLGEKKKDQNGYIVLCFPKSRFSFQKVMEVMQEILNPTDERMREAKFIWPDSSGN